MGGEVALDLHLGLLALFELGAALLTEDDLFDLEVQERVLLRVEPAVALKVLVPQVVVRIE